MDHIQADKIYVRDWDCIRFYGRVRAKEAEGYIPRMESYTVMPDINPHSGELANVYVIEMDREEGL